VFALIIVRDSFTEFSIAYEALLRWVMAFVIRVKSLEKIVAVIKELAQSTWVVERREVSTNPAAVVLLGVDA
jgi:hypothetical protein